MWCSIYVVLSITIHHSPLTTLCGMFPLLLLLLLKANFLSSYMSWMQALPSAGWLAWPLVHIVMYTCISPNIGWGHPLKCGTHALGACVSMIICASYYLVCMISKRRRHFLYCSDRCLLERCVDYLELVYVRSYHIID